MAGICGSVEQAINEASLAVKHGYHLGLLSNGGLRQYTEAELIERAHAVAEIMPLFGFYLQPAAGGACSATTSGAVLLRSQMYMLKLQPLTAIKRLT